MRKLDKTKKSNIKCEHCEYWDDKNGYCKFHREEKWYYQRCNDFKWHNKYNYDVEKTKITEQIERMKS